MIGLLAGILASLAAGTLPPDLRPFPLDAHRSCFQQQRARPQEEQPRSRARKGCEA
jgi:hypothetical protein